MAEGLGLQASVVGRIDGSVRVQERDSILQAARIVVMTPDVCHAWLMSRLSLPFVKAFVARLAIVVMDEAHTLDGVFGSNFAFLIRRLLAARDRIQNRAGISQAPQFVAATATIANPKAHLEALTGSEFTAISEALDGSPSYERMCAHVAAPVGHEMEVARALHAVLLRAPAGGGFITFVDSRRGVESLARTDQQEISDLLGSSDVLPYLIETHT
jgi:DEAD/DEAH box helicase domain-containing protein